MIGDKGDEEGELELLLKRLQRSECQWIIESCNESGGREEGESEGAPGGLPMSQTTAK